MIRHDLSPAEVRVLGCLIEKQRTTPDQYPLTRNAMRLACNQATNRDPVVDYDEATVRAALERLGRNGLVRFTSTRGSRAAKYRHIAGEALGIGDPDLSVLALLMLRGPQTPGELRGRSERLHRFRDMSELEEALSRLIEAGLAVRFERRPGQKEQRCAHLLSSALEDPVDRRSELPPPELGADDLGAGAAEGRRHVEAGAAAPGAEPPAPRAEPPAPGADRPAPRAGPPAPTPDLDARVSALEADLRALRRQLADLLED